jgi:nitrate/TMAO reductase-like tetraheme cytochrome c subunit
VARARVQKLRLYVMLGLVVLGVGLGAGALAVVEQAAQRSESIEFCTSCHIMDATVFEEYKETSHYSNASGMRATCADCHVPDRHSAGEVTAYLSTKIGAVRFLYGWATGRASEPEHLLERREEMAERVWAEMRASDSRACRRCHDDTAWDLAVQTTRAREQHLSAEQEGQTCIDCHDDGIAHEAVARATPEEEQEQDFSLD